MADSEGPRAPSQRPWVQVIVSFLLWFNGWGIVNSFGAWQTYYEENLLSKESSSNISWIGSIQAFLLLVIGCVAGRLFDLGYARSLTAVGSLLIVFGIMMTSISSTYWQVLLAQGLCQGLGAGLIYIPSVAVLPQFYTKRRAFAQGIAASGSSLGGIVYTLSFAELEHRVGFPWATRIIGFIAFITLLVASLLIRQINPPRSTAPLFDTGAFRDVSFLCFTVAATAAFIGLYVPIFYIKSYILHEQLADPSIMTYILPVLNAANGVGRVIPNFFADSTGPLNMLIPCSLATSVIAYSWIASSTTPSITAFAVLYGFFSGTFVSLSPTSLTSLSPSLSVVGQRIGTCFTIASFGLLLGSPLSGLMIRELDSYIGPQILSGSTLFIATCSLVVGRYAKAGARLSEIV
ncbi:hypothetical protein FE257_009160 [Aspergillus nanangensis]|uniref:Major facilitator superfamily (MFS) profile domain-containing protein n=1 Tax=Aspergillus nanangensis TaxID=2582783 RepID=A0AAD4CKF5_ASPNN|nr:hypothetical protein FE257_009160 [Aspergillus nanangensis]